MRRALEYAAYLGIRMGAYSRVPLPPEQLLAAIQRTHVSMYVTFSECCPMLPLESLSVGVPCLTGPTSHLFEDDELLRERLIVPFPDRAEVIAKYAERAAADREAIVARYAQYAVAYNAKARAMADAFLNED